ncbi:hypothetical protein K474DRAFT_1651388 [Panus rudis PR-1116 ss-1]|nr:hypothetical protein K474DRAFT_1651388 [Panus rudis PR-1116 ss-1]
MTYPGAPLHRSKRQRLSSPTYDEQVVLSQEEVAAFDDYDKNLTQSSQRQSSPLKMSQTMAQADRRKRDAAIAAALGLKEITQDDEIAGAENDTRSPSPCDPASRKENEDPSSSHAYSPGTPRKSRRNSPKSPSKSNPTSPRKFKGFQTAATLSGSKPANPRDSGVAFGFASALSVDRTTTRTPPPPEVHHPNPLPALLGFTSALHLPQDTHPDRSRSTSPHTPPARDIDAWFEPTTVPPGPIGFTSAKMLASNAPEEPAPTTEVNDDRLKPTTDPPAFIGFQTAKALQTNARFNDDEPHPPDGSSQPHNLSPLDSRNDVEMGPPAFIGFATGKSLLAAASNKLDPSGIIMPSAAAFERARARMALWQQEDEGEIDDGSLVASTTNQATPAFLRAAAPSQSSVVNSPTPAAAPIKHTTPAVSRIQGGTKPFKSPVINRPQVTSRPGAVPKSPAPLVRPSMVGPPVTPLRSGGVPSNLGASSAKRPFTPLRLTSANKTPASRPAKFVTPFKPGMKPGEPGRLDLERNQSVNRIQYAPDTPVKIVGNGRSPVNVNVKGKERADGKRTLESCGRVPQSYTVEQLEAMGINTSELSHITPELAEYYAFHSASSAPPSPSQSSVVPTIPLGPIAAYNRLKEDGCRLATQEWVTNHWCLILWKLAGMVALEPERESDPQTKRWCWPEVIRQLKYRYNRELNGGHRPALRLITTQDAPASSPMVLCISNILWPAEDDDGESSDSIPHLEVTDGWYRLRAEVDAPMARAIRRGIITVGRKIGVAGCRIESDRKEPAEILEAYDSTTLLIYGNSTHLAPWHARLGFQREPFIATMRSLTADGGLVALMDVVIERQHPIAYIETFEEEDGSRRTEGPRSEKEEYAAHEKWRAKREVEAGKLRYDFEKEMQRWEGYVDRLERKAGSQSRPSAEDTPPEHIDDFLIQLEDPTARNFHKTSAQLIKSLSPRDAHFLSHAIQAKVTRDRERFYETMESELDAVCPKRNVTNFRVVEVRDARCGFSGNGKTARGRRKARVTIWNVLDLVVSEGSERRGHFVPGQRFLVTNLLPAQPGAWNRNPDEECMIYLKTRRDSRWTKIRS